MAAGEGLRTALKLALALEVISVGLVQCTFHTAARSELIYNGLNALIGYVHNNCIGLLELMYWFLKAADSKNSSAAAIHTVLINRKGSACELADLDKLIRGRNEAIKKMIDKVMKFKTGSKVFAQPTPKQKSVYTTLEKLLHSVDTGKVELDFVYEATKEAAKALPRTVVKQGPIALPVVRSPFLPPLKEGEKAYTLVLDLDETLVHYCDVFLIPNA